MALLGNYIVASFVPAADGHDRILVIRLLTLQFLRSSQVRRDNRVMGHDKPDSIAGDGGDCVDP
jgi:hypothetical protein